MSTCAIMLVKDEADVIEYTLRHLARQVDDIIVADNLSTDGTSEILDELRHTLPLTVLVDEEVGYWQSRKTTDLAKLALNRGHAWVVPCDADEYWYDTDGRRLADALAGYSPDVSIVTADLYYHVPTVKDEPAQANPFRRIGWRKRERERLPKVACRCRPDLVIDAGNHSARTRGTAVRAAGPVIRHFSWRSEEQYLRKIHNGIAAYKATDLPDDIGLHWRMWSERSDEAILEHYRHWFCSANPKADPDLIYDPAPFTVE